MYSPTVDDLLKPYKNYPKAIQQAILLVETHPRFIGLTRSMKSVLKAFLTRANQRNGTTPIKARLDIVATQADVSTKTVERTVKALREAGWMYSITDGRSAWGLFESKRYQLTDMLCEIVGLPTTTSPSVLAVATKMSDGAVYVDLSFKEDHREIRLKNRTKTSENNPIVLPGELQPLIELGVKETGVCKLRGLAHIQGYNLADLIIVARKALETMKGSANRIFCYLQKMINTPSDYAARANQLQRMVVENTAVQQTKQRSQRYAHQRFIAGNGVIVRIFDGIAEISRDGQWLGNIVGQGMNEVYNDIESGKLRAVVL